MPESTSPDNPQMLDGLLPNSTCGRHSGSGSSLQGALGAAGTLGSLGKAGLSPGHLGTLRDLGPPQEDGDHLVHISSWRYRQVGEHHALISAHDWLVLADSQAQSQASPRARRGLRRASREGSEVGTGRGTSRLNPEEKGGESPGKWWGPRSQVSSPWMLSQTGRQKWPQKHAR